jgi:hypothetical protein
VWAQVYEVRPAYRRHLVREDWDVGRYLASGAVSFEREFGRWR